MAEYLYGIQPTQLDMLTDRPTTAEAAIVREHFAYLERLSEEAIVILAGRTQNSDASSFGIVICNAATDAAAGEVAANNSAIRGGGMWAELFPYRIGL
jgi:uncharacterized protein